MSVAFAPLIHSLASQLESHRIAYCFEGITALLVQGVDPGQIDKSNRNSDTIEISVQWDQFPDAYALFQNDTVSLIEESPGASRFTFEREGISVQIHCYKNTVIVTDRYRIAVEYDGKVIWAKSIEFYRKSAETGDTIITAIEQFLQKKQAINNQNNKIAWTQNSYEAWVNRFGTPNIAADRIKKNPMARLSSLSKHLGDVQDKRVVNLLGSHGSKAVALALLGADATVVDISENNRRYAAELAKEAGVPLRYIVSDVLKLPLTELTSKYDIVLMEGGIVHYFVDLQPLGRIIHQLLRTGGRLILQDFHPISTKLITSKGKKHKVTGDYFDSSIIETEVAYAQLLNETDRKILTKVKIRRWTIGEIVTAVAGAGLFIRILEEEPNPKIDDKGIPKLFTIIAEKI